MSPRSISSNHRYPFFGSWSGGKDSCLALYRAIREGGDPKYLFTMMSEGGRASRSHGLPRSLLEEQARRIGIPIVFRSASWEFYEPVFSAALCEFGSTGIEAGVFGDIDIEAHREWCTRVCDSAGVKAIHPLWKQERRILLEEFIELTFQAIIVVVKADCLGPEWLGRAIDKESVAELSKKGIDPSGESGEYHTVVTGGPIFSSPMEIRAREPVLHDGYWFMKFFGELEDYRSEGAPHGSAEHSPSVI